MGKGAEGWGCTVLHFESQRLNHRVPPPFFPYPHSFCFLTHSLATRVATGEKRCQETQKVKKSISWPRAPGKEGRGGGSPDRKIPLCCLCSLLQLDGGVGVECGQFVLCSREHLEIPARFFRPVSPLNGQVSKAALRSTSTSKNCPLKILRILIEMDLAEGRRGSFPS